MNASIGTQTFTEFDLHLFREGTHQRLFEKLGTQLVEIDGANGARCRLWAPHASAVSVIGSFNDWSNESHPLERVGESGIWEAFLPGVGAGALYKYHIVSADGAGQSDKADPFAFYNEVAPRTASVVCSLDYRWNDDAWMRRRRAANSPQAPISIYQLHAGSWRRDPDAGTERTYREIAPQLADYAHELGFTHVELLPVMEHAFFRDWGGEPLAYFACCSGFGTPDDLMFLVDTLHCRGIGVIFEWPPYGFAADSHGLVRFDGGPLFERLHDAPTGNRLAFDLDRGEVRSFLLSSATFWLDKFHADGLHVGEIGRLLYPDRLKAQAADRETLEHATVKEPTTFHFLQQLNELVAAAFADAFTTAEDACGAAMATWPVGAAGGLGFRYERHPRWLRDTLLYLHHEPDARQHHYDEIARHWSFSDSRILAIPHPQSSVFGGGGNGGEDNTGEFAALWDSMPGDDWQKYANLRLLYGYMYALPGKKLMFMGSEFAARQPWRFDRPLDWRAAHEHPHAAVRRWVSELNRLYRSAAAPCEPGGESDDFEWIDCHDNIQSVVSFFRRSRAGSGGLLAVCNFMPIPRINFRLGVPYAGVWNILLNSDKTEFGGTGCEIPVELASEAVIAHDRPQSIVLTLPPLAIVLLKAAKRPGGAPLDPTDKR